jgi:predicted nucleic acid-binding protein
MAFVAVYDANVLYPNTLRDLLIRIAQLPHLVQAKWTEEILEEVAVALRKNLPDITAEKTDRLRERMNAAVRDCLVSGYAPLISDLELPDPGDRHVLAAAIKAKAQIIGRSSTHEPETQ